MLLPGADIKRVVISHAAASSQVCIPAKIKTKYVILQLVAYAAGVVTVQFKSASTNLTGAMTANENSPILMSKSEAGWFETVAGDELNMTLGGAVQVSGVLVYVEVPVQ